VERLPWMDFDGNMIQPAPFEIAVTAATAATAAVATARKGKAGGTAAPKAITDGTALVGKDAELRSRDALRAAQAADEDQEEEEALAPKTPAKRAAPKTPKTPPARKAAAAMKTPAAPRKKAKSW